MFIPNNTSVFTEGTSKVIVFAFASSTISSFLPSKETVIFSNIEYIDEKVIVRYVLPFSTLIKVSLSIALLAEEFPCSLSVEYLVILLALYLPSPKTTAPVSSSKASSNVNVSILFST